MIYVLSISFADNSILELTYPSNEPCPAHHCTSTFSEYKAAGMVRNEASNIKMENKAENCNLTLSAQLYGIEKQFQLPQNMLRVLESPDIKARYFPNFK